ncbi:ATP-binding protein [Streptomyces sp. NPDC014744]|uniref:ATP-binding protein n=1 Tax=Streptomyces sp. NPDC014744 TaxID=3364903 RepID=UPI0036F8C52E
MTTSQTQFFEAIPASVGRAREFTDRVLAGWKHTSRADDIRLCASELATNAVVHGSTRDHGFLVAIGLADGVVSLEVHDSRRERPTACFPVEYDTAGRGLVLVAALSDEWGVRDREPLGKVVWSRFDIAASVNRPPARAVPASPVRGRPWTPGTGTGISFDESSDIAPVRGRQQP